MSASMEDTMDVDEENMQVDEEPAVGELPMSTDEDSVQDAGVSMKVVDDAMASDSHDVDIGEGTQGGNEGPTEMESDIITDDVAGNPSLTKSSDNTGEENESTEEAAANILQDDISSLCRTEVEKTGEDSNRSEAAEEAVESGKNLEGASSDLGMGMEGGTGRDSSLSVENNADEQETEIPVRNDESSRNNDGGEELLPDRAEFDTAENSNITSASVTEENACDPFATEGDGNSNTASELQIIAANEDSTPASDAPDSSLNLDTGNKDKGGGKSLAEELSEQLGKEHDSTAVMEDSEKEKNADDHISIDDASSIGGANAENPDHVSVDGSSDGERVVDHVSVDSDSEPENASDKAPETTENSNAEDITTHAESADRRTVEAPSDQESLADNCDNTQLVIDVARALEAEKERSVPQENEPDGNEANSDPSVRADDAEKTNTVDLLDSDDERETPASSVVIRPRPSNSLKDHITLIGKAVDSETIISDGPIVVSTATVTPAPLSSSSSPSEPGPPVLTPGGEPSKVATKSQYSVKKLSSPIQWKCLHCTTFQRCPWKILVGSTYYYICGDKCLEAHRVQRRQIIETGGPPATHIIQIADISNLKKKCALCSACIPKNKVGSLTWEVMNFCDEDCLSKYQTAFTATCCNCHAVVATSSMGKYCVRFGHEVKQFCTPACLDTYKKGIKTCSYCQKNLQDSSDGFLAAVGGKDQFRDFCSQDCLEKYDCICNNSSSSYSVDNCNVCDNTKVTQFELLSATKVAKLCSDVCLAAYKFVNNIDFGLCAMCNKYYDTHGVDESVTFNNDVPSTFCSKHCMNINVISKRKIVPCAWCKAKKYNFDMIYRRGATDEDGLFVCSVNCLALHNVSLKAVTPKKVNCSYCKKLEISTYHITMSDASIRHFCSYECVLSFQSAFNVPLLNANAPVPEGVPKKIVRPSDTTVGNSTSATLIAPSPGPTIQSVSTLKPVDTSSPPALVATSSANKMKHTALKIPSSFCFKPPEMKNKWTQITVCRTAKCVSCKPKKEERDVQCDLGETAVNGEKSATVDSTGEYAGSQTKAVIPIPVPIYIPHPMAMYTLPSPVPIPVPVPIIVPIIIPTSLENMDKVIDTMKEILEKSFGEGRSSSSVMAVQSEEIQNKCFNTMKSGMSLDEKMENDGNGRKKRELEDEDPLEDPVPSKRARVSEEVTSPSGTESPVKMKLKYMLGPNAWRHFVKNWNLTVEDDKQLKVDILSMRPHELNNALTVFIREARKVNGDEYKPDLKFYLSLGIQYYLLENGRVDDIFGDTLYEEFSDALDVEARKFNALIDSSISRVEEEHLWESMQLGAKSPHVLLFTLMYFISLRFNLWTLDDHMQLSFNSFRREIHGLGQKSQAVIKLVLNNSDGSDLEKQREFEFTENKKDLLRCPVRFYEFYIAKCPENVRTQDLKFYLMPESSCVPESPVWYKSLALPPHMVGKMINRVKMVKEIQDLMHERTALTPNTEETF